MRMKSYKPLDEECYQMEEYEYNTSTGEKTFTGKRYRKVGNQIPREDDAYRAFVQDLKTNGRVILYNPKDLVPCAYELVMGK